MPKKEVAHAEHSIIEITVGNLERIEDPVHRISLIDSLDRRLDALRGRSVLEKVELQNRVVHSDEVIPASRIAVTGIMRGRFADEESAEDHLLEES